MYDAREVANAMLVFAQAEGIKLTNLKLQKLLYLAHGQMLTQENKTLIKDGFEAWAYGPVSRTAYHAFKHFDSEPISGPATRFNPILRIAEEIEINIDTNAAYIIEDVVSTYGRWNEFELVELTHRPGSPWSITVENALTTANVGMVISDELISLNFEILAE